MRQHAWRIRWSMYKLTLYFVHDFFVLCCKSTLNRWKWNRSWHKWTVRPSVRPSVCLSRSRIVSIGLARRHTFFTVRYSNHSGFPRTKTSLRTSDGVTGALNTDGVYFFSNFRPTSGSWERTEDRAIVTIWNSKRKSYALYRTVPFLILTY